MLHLLAAALAVVTFATSPAFAQQRPLLTEDAETIGTGRVLIEAGLDLEREVFYPLSGLEGNRLSVPTIGISVGLSPFAEIQLDGGLYQRLDITDRRPAPLAFVLDVDGDRTHDVEDFYLATKIRLVAEGPGRPAFGLRFTTKLPTANNEAGLGSNMLDFHAQLLVAKTIESVRIVGNVGAAIIGDPVATSPEQNEMMLFGVSVARAISTAAEVVGEVNGRVTFENGPEPGAENRAVMRLGARYTRGTVRVDGAILLGMTSRDPQFGLTTGVTWVFDAFRTP